MSQQPMDIEKRVAQYVELRDKIKELDEAHKEKMHPFRETLEGLNNLLLDHLKTINSESVKTSAGTVYATVKKSASIADASAFWTFVVTTADFDLIDKRANVTAVSDFIKKNKTVPPGVNYNETRLVGVRRPTK